MHFDVNGHIFDTDEMIFVVVDRYPDGLYIARDQSMVVCIFYLPSRGVAVWPLSPPELREIASSHPDLNKAWEFHVARVSGKAG